MEVWSGMDGADCRPGGRLWEKVMWKWNAAELDARQRPLQSRRERLLKNWKQSENLAPPGRDYPALVSPWSPLLKIIWFATLSRHRAGLFSYLYICLFWTSSRSDTKNSTRVMRGDPAPREPRQRRTNNYGAITARLWEIGEGMHHSASSWRRELTQQATCKTGKEFAARESAAGRQRLELRRPGVTVGGGKKIKLPSKRHL